MNIRTLAIAPILTATLTGLGCSAAPIESTTSESNEAITACPTAGTTDDQMRAAATVAFNIMRKAAKVGGSSSPVYSNTILAAQRYRLASGGGVEFDPADPLYKYVTDSMKADLLFAQQDSSVAAFLANGLSYAYANTNGLFFPSIAAISVLANFTYPNTTATLAVADPTSANNSHTASATGAAWCNTAKAVITETVQQSWAFAPLNSQQITTPDPGGGQAGSWLKSPPTAFKGSSYKPWTPFNGNVASGNPYLIISVNGTATNWATYSFNPANCYDNYPSYQCTGTIEIDPVPYAEPGDYYNATGAVGTQANPFQLDPSVLYAAPEHANQWATRTVNSVQQWGTFSTSTTLCVTSASCFTEYKYVKKY